MAILEENWRVELHLLTDVSSSVPGIGEHLKGGGF